MIATVGFCAQYHSVWRVPSSKRDGTSYEVVMNGAESNPTCSCPAWLHSSESYFSRHCKHIDLVIKHACLWNPQWNRTGGPNDFAEHGIELVAIDEHHRWPEPCRVCGGPAIATRVTE
jgi:hypothetical protein